MSNSLVDADDDFWNHPSLLQYCSIASNSNNNHSSVSNNSRKRNFTQIQNSNSNTNNLQHMNHPSNKRQRTASNTYAPNFNHNHTNSYTNYQGRNHSNTNQQHSHQAQHQSGYRFANTSSNTQAAQHSYTYNSHSNNQHQNQSNSSITNHAQHPQQTANRFTSTSSTQPAQNSSYHHPNNSNCNTNHSNSAHKQNSSHTYHTPQIAPECNHKLPMIQRTTRKPGPNCGRSFWCCSQSKQNQCKRFLWDNQWQRDLKNMKQSKTGRDAYKLLMAQKFTVSTELICIKPIALVEISIHPAEQIFVECVKQLANAQWHQTKRKWVIPLNQHSKLIRGLRNKCAEKQYTFTMDVIPNEIIKQAMKWNAIQSKHDNEDCLMVLPLKLRSSMYTFQKEGVQFAVSKGGRCLIADEMGLGKSIQAIAIAYIYRDDWPLLIVVPSSLTLTWKCEILKWLKEIVFEDDIKIIKKGNDMMVKYDDKLGCSVPLCPITIISYGLAVRKHAEIMDNERLFGMIICDESHALKNYKTKRCKVLMPLIKRNVRRALLLSGTPTNNRPSELWTQIDALRPKEFMSFKKYSIRYCEGQNSKFGWVANGAIHLKELHAIIKHRVMIRRCKKEVLTELPDKLRTVINIECDKALEKKIAKKMQKDLCLKEEIESMNNSDCVDNTRNEEKDSVWDKKNKNMLLLYALTGKSKIAKIKEYIYDLFESGEKFLVFAHHQDVLDAIQDCVENKCKTQFIRIDGNTKPDKRQVLVDKFQNNDKIRIAVLSITAAGTGLTLTAATSVVFAELYWGPTALLQCEDRAHRISQTSIVNIIYLLGAGSLDDRMWPMISKKMEVISKTLTGKQLTMEVESYKHEYIKTFSPTKRAKENRNDRNQNNGKQKLITSMLTLTPARGKQKHK